MGNPKNIPSWNHACQRVHSKDQRPVSNFDPKELVKEERETLGYDKDLQRHSRIEREW